MDLILKKRPVIIAGVGCTTLAAKSSGSLRKPSRFVGVTQAGKSCLVWDHPSTWAELGLPVRKQQTFLPRSRSDHRGRFTAAGLLHSLKTAFQNPEVDFVSINVNRFDALKMDSVYVQADAKLGLIELGTLLKEAGYKSGYTEDYLKKLKDDWNKEVDRLYSLESPEGIVQTTALGVVNEFVQDSDIVVCAGSLGDLHRLWRSKGIKTYHMEYGFSTMGYEIAGALGVKMAEPEREIFALVSDGSYLMLHSELLTSVQEGMKINVVMFDNGGFQSILSLQKSKGSKGFGNELRFRDPETGLLTGDYVPIDFAQMAGAMGVKTFSVRNLADLPKALQAARESKVSTLIDIKILPATQSDGYESWWRVGVAEVSES